MVRTVLELTAAVASGDREAFAEFYRDWFEPVLNHARRTSHADESFCLDITQEVFMRVIRTLPAMEDRTDVERWLICVVRSCVVDGLRWVLRQKRREQAVAGREASAAEPGRLEVQEKIAWLEAELAGLQAPHRELIDMRFRLGWTLQRIGIALGLNPGAVDGRISRIIRGLQRRARETFHDE